jgi:hypothetical protein
MLVVEGPGLEERPVVLPFSPSPLPESGPSPKSDSGGLSVCLSPHVAAGNEPLVVAAATVNAVGTELESPSRRTKFTYVLTNPVELNFGRQMGSHDAEAELL